MPARSVRHILRYTCFDHNDGRRNTTVIARTHTLSPNDEMLRLLEAMGLLALLTRETPAEIAAERKSLRKILESSASQANAVAKRMEECASRFESRLTQLPKELETGLDPPRIAKLLGESLRQFPAIRFTGHRGNAWPVLF